MNIADLDEADIKQLALQQVALRCKTDLFFLDKEILGYSKMTKNTHQTLCDYTTSVLPNPPEISIEGFDPRKNLLLLLMPRGTFKSSLMLAIPFATTVIPHAPGVRSAQTCQTRPTMDVMKQPMRVKPLHNLPKPTLHKPWSSLVHGQ